MIDIVFLGTPDFAVPSLEALIDNGYNVKAVITQPDRPKGRGNRLCASPVKECAVSHGIPVFQPEKIRRENDILLSLKPDLMVTAAFGQILSKENLDAPRLGCINVHGSLLPKYRGSSPIQWAVINGEEKTGITTMFTDVGIDSGDILLQEETAIGENETAGELFDRLSHLGASVLIKTVRALEAGTLKRIPQNAEEATHFPMLDKEKAQIDFSRSAREIKNFVRGNNPWPVAWCKMGEETVKIYAVSVTDNKSVKPCGTVVNAEGKGGLLIATGDYDISIDMLQMPGKRPMNAKDFFAGNSIKVTRLNEC